MSDTEKKIENLMHLLKIDIEDTKSLEKDFESILEMFDSIKNFEVEGTEAKMIKKQISLEDLREDIVKKFENFEPKFKGKYIKVPSVSKK